MSSWFQFTALVLVCTGNAIAALLVERDTQVETRQLHDERTTALETLRIRAGSSSTTPSRQPTTSTPNAVPLTTIFVPPESCNEGRLTMLSSPAFHIWLNEPFPVPGTTFSDCYPSEFLQHYSTYRVNPTTMGSHVPMMSPLVCPLNWNVVATNDVEGQKYGVCCPNGYLITYPTTTLDSKRPAYGGTCYKQWPAGSSAFVVAYNSASLASTMLITSQSFPGFANYAHVIDGVLAASTSQTPSSTSSSTSHLSSPPQSVFPAASAPSVPSAQKPLQAGAIAGIVVGAVAAVGLLATGGYLLFRRRRKWTTLPPTPPPKDDVTSSSLTAPMVTSRPDNYNIITPERTHRDLSEMAAESHVHELEGAQSAYEKP